MRIIIFILLLPAWAVAQTKSNDRSLELSGTYKYVGKTYKKGEDIYGYFGSVKIKQISTEKIAISFYICKGAPSYNSGSFVDTLIVRQSKAEYKPDCDSSC